MKRLARAVAWGMLLALAALGPFIAAALPVRNDQLSHKSYESWTGVLRLWKCEGWSCGAGSLTGWLNSCIATFEKRNPGVYVQVTDVSEETLRSFCDGTLNPPDLILFAPGMLEDASHLKELSGSLPLRPSLRQLGMENGTRRAVPIALGGYALAVNTLLLDTTPEDWREQPAPTPGPRTPSNLKKATFSLLNAPRDGNYTSWSAAMLALFSGSVAQGEQAQTPVGDGLDVGLATTEPTVSPAPTQMLSDLKHNSLPLALNSEFRQSESVYSAFTAGKLAAMPVTQREIRRLQLLADSGKGPDWRVETMGLPFTDQAALLAVVDWPRDDGPQRQALSEKLISFLLADERQAKLTMARAFPVTECSALYAGDSGLTALERALSSDNLTLPPAFGNAWRVRAGALMDGVSAGGETAAAYETLRALLRESSE